METTLPTINFKIGVWLKFIDYRFLWLAKIIWEVYREYDQIPTVTSACDGKHMANSWHYKGLGWDWRIWGIDDPKTPINEIKEAVDKIREKAKEMSPRYDIVYGDPQHLDHIHSEYDENKII